MLVGKLIDNITNISIPRVMQFMPNIFNIIQTLLADANDDIAISGINIVCNMLRNNISPEMSVILEKQITDELILAVASRTNQMIASQNKSDK